jgi:hypothetical protein
MEGFRPSVCEAKHTLSLDIADFWSLVLKKVAPRRCLSESLRSLKDMAGGGGRVDAKAVVGGRICSSAGSLLMCVGPRDVRVSRLEVDGSRRKIVWMVVCCSLCG